MATMKSWQYSRVGAFEDTLKLNDIPKPDASSLKADDILVKVARAGINPGEWKSARSRLIVNLVINKPKTPAMDVSGRVEAIGDNVKDIKVGDTVIVLMRLEEAQGGLQEYVVVQRSRCAAVRKPGVDLTQIAGVPGAGQSAYQALVPHIKAGDEVLINGGGGGTGTFGIQIAKNLGCRVTVTCSTSKIDLCKRLGADEVIDYRTENVLEKLRGKGQRFAVVMDTVGYSPTNFYTSSHEFLLPKGKFVLVGIDLDWTFFSTVLKGTLLPTWLGGGRRELVRLQLAENQENFDQLAAWVNEGKLETAIDTVYEFDKAIEAFRQLAGGSTAGKIVIKVS